ncbi:MAG: Bax inhibitor-1/YccA family protein [Phycisphaerales bacterium]|jgi:uncharacterized YccA/Bax inhibitor family protein|nr:Bax inhibitor-1/YccA family protein [Phycisphaerales bacterium]
MPFGNNPAFKPELFEGQGSWASDLAKAKTMTIGGAVNATFICLTACIGAAVTAWWAIRAGHIPTIGAMLGGLIPGLILSLIMIFKPTTARFLAIPFALFEGGFLGGISLVYADAAQGTKWGGATGTMIVANAGLLTFATLGAMLGLYKFGIIRATERFKSIMLICGVAIALYALASLAMRFFGVMPAGLLGGPLAIAIAVGILVYSAFCLILDFDLVEQGAASNAPKHMEWYAAFATLSTLVWIYLNFLRLLSLLNRSED